MVRASIVLFTALAFVTAPLAASAAPPRDTREVPMTTGERLGNGAAGVGLVTSGAAIAYVAGATAMFGAAIVGVAALPVIATGLVAVGGVALVAWGGYKIFKAIRGRKEVDAGVRLPGPGRIDGGETTRPGGTLPNPDSGPTTGGTTTEGPRVPIGGTDMHTGINVGRDADTRPGLISLPNRPGSSGGGAPR